MFGRGDDHHGGVRVPGHFDGLGDQLVRLAPGAEVHQREHHTEDRGVGPLVQRMQQRHVHRLACGECDLPALDRGAEERLERAGLHIQRLSAVEQHLVRDSQPEAPDTAGAEGVLSAPPPVLAFDDTGRLDDLAYYIELPFGTERDRAFTHAA